MGKRLAPGSRLRRRLLRQLLLKQNPLPALFRGQQPGCLRADPERAEPAASAEGAAVLEGSEVDVIAVRIAQQAA